MGAPADAAHAASMSGVEVLYNSVCPVCHAGACDLERRRAVAKAGVTLTDVSQDAEALKCVDQVRLKMHAIDANGRVLAGMPAVALAWAVTPPYRPLGRLMQIAPFSWIGAGVYHVLAHVLWAWNRANGRW
jgi:predicted DCC family thiol-disulfide oxidoreductase YuxK